ncbi:Virulence factor Mce protein like protein, partial [Aduncisulcus paluster]
MRGTATRGPVIGLAVFLVIATALTWLVYVTLRRDVKGSTVSYAAMFTDVFGLREGDDVRIAGVRVGRIQHIELIGTTAKVSFAIQDNQRLPVSTTASVTYQNIVGQRYLALAQSNSGPAGLLAPGAVIPVERTEPSFDIGTLLNGYEPLFAVLDPAQVNNLTQAVIGSLQGDTASFATLVDQTSTLTKTFTGRDDALDHVIASLDNVVGSLAAQNRDFEDAIRATRQVVGQFDSRRPELVSSVGKMTEVVRSLSRIARDIAYTGLNTPLFLKGLARMFGEGAYMNAWWLMIRPLDSYNKTWLGVIAVAVIAALIGGLLLAAALRPGNIVTVAGVQVGSVTGVRLAGDRVEATFRVRDNMPVGAESRAAIKITTLFGSRYVDLRPAGSGMPADRRIDLQHTEVPYDLQAALADSTRTFEQVDADRIASSLNVLGTQLDGLPDVVPQAMENVRALSSVIAQRRDQLGTLLTSTESVTSMLRRQQSDIGTFIHQGQELVGEFVARSAAFHAMMRSLQSIVASLRTIVVGDHRALD